MAEQSPGIGASLTQFAQDNPVTFNALLGAAKSEIVDKPNERYRMQQEVINQQYSPFTGKQADFAGVKRANTFGSVLGGVGAGLAQLQNQKQRKELLDAIKESKPVHTTLVGDNNRISTPLSQVPNNFVSRDAGSRGNSPLGVSPVNKAATFADLQETNPYAGQSAASQSLNRFVNPALGAGDASALVGTDTPAAPTILRNRINSGFVNDNRLR